LAWARSRAEPLIETPPPGVSTRTLKAVLDQGEMAAVGADDGAKGDVAQGQKLTLTRHQAAFCSSKSGRSGT
jgi:hypothetical protein